MECRVPEFIRELNAKHITQAEIARAVGVRRTTVNSWATGVRRPGPLKMQALSDYYQVSIGWLMGEDCEKMLKPVIEFDNKTADKIDLAMKGESPVKIALVKALIQLPEEDVRAIWHAIDLMYQYRHSYDPNEGLPEFWKEEQIIARTIKYLREIADVDNKKGM